MDLVQIRWQQVRLAEASQLVTRENIELKRRLAQIQQAKVVQPKQGNDLLSQKYFLSLKKGIDEFIVDCSGNLISIKKDLKNQQESTAQMCLTVRRISERFGSILQNKEVELVRLETENCALRGELEMLKSKLAEKDSRKHDENDSWERKLQSLKKELDSVQASKSRLEKELEKKNEDLFSLVRQKEQLSSELESAQGTVSTLRGELAKMEAELGHSAAIAAEEKRHLSMNYEKMIEDMSVDNQYLRGTVADLEEQIAKLSCALVGNKSHFAKYVEVKTENLMLQTKLESLGGPKQVRPLGSSGPTGTASAPSAAFLPQLRGQLPSGSSSVVNSARRASMSDEVLAPRHTSSQEFTQGMAQVVPPLPTGPGSHSHHVSPRVSDRRVLQGKKPSEPTIGASSSTTAPASQHSDQEVSRTGASGNPSRRPHPAASKGAPETSARVSV